MMLSFNRKPVLLLNTEHYWIIKPEIGCTDKLQTIFDKWGSKPFGQRFRNEPNQLGKKFMWFLLKVSFFLHCSKMQLIPLKKFNIQTCFFQFLWFFRFKCWFKGQIISKIHLSLPNAYKLMCFDRNINGNRDVKFFEWDYWSLHWRKNLTLVNTYEISLVHHYTIYHK